MSIRNTYICGKRIKFTWELKVAYYVVNGPKVNKQGKIKYLLKESESVKGTLWLKEEMETQEALEKPLENIEAETILWAEKNI